VNALFVSEACAPTVAVPYRLYRRCFALVLLLCGLAATATAAELPAERLRELAQHPQWLRLLHASVDGRHSEIHSPEFFLSPQGATDPEAELRATLAGLSADTGADPNAHARCRFPARHAWLLSQQVALPGPAQAHSACPRLAQWGRFDQLRSISLLLVSGYFGNPASSFGHSLLRFNTDEGRASEGLTDLGINFGALVPDRESTLVYVFKGLTGGYQAGFSDKPYYSHDLIYSRTEFRDMWDHELALSEAERLMLAYHLWEIVGRKFTYYFLKENCAWRIAELLALVRNDDLLARSSVWFAPVEVFHRLHEAERRSGKAWFRSVRFVPSAERVLRHQFAQLSPDEARVANTTIAQHPTEPGRLLGSVAPERRIDVLDALTAYNNYRVAAEEPTVSAATTAAKDAALRARLSLPARRPADNPIPQLQSPAEASAPMLSALAAGHHERHGSFAQLRWAPFSYELSGHNGLTDGELVVFDVAANLDGEGVTLDRLDVIRVKKLNAQHTRIHGEDWLSWQVEAGARREDVDGDSRLRLTGRIGGGYAAPWGADVTAYAMVDAVAFSRPSSLGLEPNAGLVVRAGRWKLWALASTRYESATHRWQPRQHLEATYRLSADRALRFELTRQRSSRGLVTLLQYW
jgi:hypothetical protein